MSRRSHADYQLPRRTLRAPQLLRHSNSESVTERQPGDHYPCHAVDRTTAQRFGGTGLGPAVTRKLARMMVTYGRDHLGRAKPVASVLEPTRDQRMNTIVPTACLLISAFSLWLRSGFPAGATSYWI